MRYVLGIETSCDETAAAVVEDGVRVRSNVVASQVAEHRLFGGVVPEIASRRHLDAIAPTVARALADAGVSFAEIDGVAVTCGPGLIGALLVGVSYAKAAAFALGKPLIGVHHIEGHIFSSAFEHPPMEYPALALIVSGGHTNVFHLPAPGVYERLGRTRDDAAGEAYDKVARVVGLGYPGGPILDRLARTGDPAQVRLTYRPPLIPDAPFDFSFSGLKTAVLRYVREREIAPAAGPDDVGQPIRDLAASFQRAVVTTLLAVLNRALDAHPPRMVLVGGGVACNSLLREELRSLARRRGVEVRIPSPVFTTDNAAMIAAAGYARLTRGERSDWRLAADPTLRLHRAADEPPARGAKRFRA
jgi:N6-L-threonylcarbamoyladenine synthase